MKEPVKKTQVPAEEELVDVLLDFIMVSASLAKKVMQAIRMKEGERKNEQSQRYGYDNQAASQCGRCNY